MRYRKESYIALTVGALVLVGSVFFWSDRLMEWLQGRSPAEEQALQALDMLRALTQTGITYQDYVARLNEVQVQVDRSLLAMADRGSQTRQAVELALNYYLAAGLAWQATLIHRESSWVALAQRLPRDTEFAMCPAVRLVFGQAEKERPPEETFALEALSAAPFWSCAAQQVSRAQRLSGAAKP